MSEVLVEGDGFASGGAGCEAANKDRGVNA